MAKQRIVYPKFWDDSYIIRLTPTEKLLFLYLLTNPLTTIAGVFELPLRRVAFDTEIEKEEIDKTFKKFETDGKIVSVNGWIWIVNFIKYQKTASPTVRTGIIAELSKAPDAIKDRLSIGYSEFKKGENSPSHPNPDPDQNLDPDLNPNGFSPKKFSTDYPQNIEKEKRELGKKWKA